jgi:hypothetical protein
MTWFGWGWDGFGLACVESNDLYNTFVDRTVRLIQHNWVVLAYNLNIIILVLIIRESSIGAISAYHFITVLSLVIPCIIILFKHLLSTNHKCTQPFYFHLLLKPAAQKEKMDWNSSTKSSRLRVAPVAVPVELCSLPLFHFIESHHSLWRYYLCNNYTLFLTFGYL